MQSYLLCCDLVSSKQQVVTLHVMEIYIPDLTKKEDEDLRIGLR